MPRRIRAWPRLGKRVQKGCASHLKERESGRPGKRANQYFKTGEPLATHPGCKSPSAIGTNRKSSGALGLHMHSTCAGGGDGIPLGVPRIKYDAPEAGVDGAPEEERKTRRWVHGLRNSAELAAALEAVRTVAVMDCEGGRGRRLHRIAEPRRRQEALREDAPPPRRRTELHSGRAGIGAEVGLQGRGNRAHDGRANPVRRSDQRRDLLEAERSHAVRARNPEAGRELLLHGHRDRGAFGIRQGAALQAAGEPRPDDEPGRLHRRPFAPQKRPASRERRRLARLSEARRRVPSRRASQKAGTRKREVQATAYRLKLRPMGSAPQQGNANRVSLRHARENDSQCAPLITRIAKTQ